MCGNGTKSGVQADQFCAHYAETCGYAATDRFISKVDCMTRYSRYHSVQRGCVAYHLCLAGQSAENKMTHCPYPSGQGGNPCMVTTVPVR
jgi:hypothetical protein